MFGVCGDLTPVQRRTDCRSLRRRIVHHLATSGDQSLTAGGAVLTRRRPSSNKPPHILAAPRSTLSRSSAPLHLFAPGSRSYWVI